MLLKTKKLISFIIALFILNLGIIISKLYFNINNITEKEKCPACFGISMCQEIDNNTVTLEFTNFYSIFNNLFNIKNVYYGKYNNEKVIIKKLAHNSELKSFDEMVCNNDKLFELCYNKSKIIETKTNFYESIISELSNSDMTDPNMKIRICPTISKINELFLNIDIQNTVENEDYYKFLWTLIKINPEPIILQILPSTNNWPTPKYFGACGRLVIEEYSGLPLSTFINESWLNRALIASSLLDAAYIFTFKNLKFGFYLTDISMDNIAVNAQNKAVFVDLENIIIVDKYPSANVLKQKTEWNKTYVNRVDSDCEDCFIFSPTDICNHKYSDHNYYAICQHILTQGLSSNLHNQGFLHHIPDTILKQFPELINLLKQCSRPDTPYSRIDFGIELKRVLDTIIKNVK